MDDYRDYLAGPSRRRSRWPMFFGMVAVFAVAFSAAVAKDTHMWGPTAFVTIKGEK